MALMSDSHRMFLQTFMSKFILNAKEVNKLFQQVCGKFEEEHSLVEFVQTINNHIKPIHLEIKKGVSEDTGSNSYVLVNTNENHDLMKFSTEYTSNELELFKKMLENILEHGQLTETDALNLVSELNFKMMKKEAQDFIEKLRRDKWLTKGSGYVSLDTRALMELDNYLKDTYPDLVFNCELCKRICVRGQNCHSCDLRLHLHCAARFLQGQATPTCPAQGCGAPWPHAVPTLAQKGPNPDNQSQAQVPPSQQTRKRRR